MIKLKAALPIFLLFALSGQSAPGAPGQHNPPQDSQSDAAPQVPDYAGDFVAARDARMTSAGGTATRPISELPAAAMDGVRSTSDSLGRAGTATANTINAGADKVRDFSGSENKAQWLKDGAENTARAAGRKIKETASAVKTKVSETYNEARRAAGRKIDAAGEAIVNAPQNASDALGRGGQKVADTINEAYQSGGTSIKEAAKRGSRAAANAVAEPFRQTGASASYAKDELGKLKSKTGDYIEAKMQPDTLENRKAAARHKRAAQKQASKVMREGANAAWEKVKFAGKTATTVAGGVDTVADVASGYTKEAQRAAQEDRDISAANVAVEAGKNLTGLAAGERGMEIGKEESLKLEREGKRGFNKETATAVGRGMARVTDEMFYSGGKKMSEKIIQEEMVNEMRAAEKEGRKPDISAAKRRAAVRVAGEVSGVNAIAEAVHYDAEADRQMHRTGRRLQEKAEDKLAQQIGRAGRLKDEVEALSAEDSPEARAEIAQKKEEYQKILSQIDTEQTRLGQRGLVNQDTAGYGYLKGELSKLPKDLGSDLPVQTAVNPGTDETPTTSSASDTSAEASSSKQNSEAPVEAASLASTSSGEGIEEPAAAEEEAEQPPAEQPTGEQHDAEVADAAASSGANTAAARRGEPRETVSVESIARRSRTRSGDPNVELLDPRTLEPLEPGSGSAHPGSFTARSSSAPEQTSSAALPVARRQSGSSVERVPVTTPSVPRAAPTTDFADDGDLFSDFDAAPGEFAAVEQGVRGSLERSNARLNNSRAAGRAASARVQRSVESSRERVLSNTRAIEDAVESSSTEAHRVHVREREAEIRRRERIEYDRVRRERARERQQAAAEQRRREQAAARAREAAQARAAARERVNQRRQGRSTQAARRPSPPSRGQGNDLGTVGTGGRTPPSGALGPGQGEFGGPGTNCIYGVIGDGC